MRTANVLKEYVQKEDNFYSWKIDSREEERNFDLYRATLQSQKWKDLLWKHGISLVVPKEVKYDYVLLLISGSRSGLEELMLCKMLSGSLNLSCAVLQDVPNQPLFNGLYEDEIISYTFLKFIETQDEEWPLLLPMVKSARAAIDTIESILEKTLRKPKGFIVIGASKRGWTTWLLAAVDKRVVGIAPLVFDNLNFNEQMKHQLECYGDYSEQIQDYTKLGIQKLMYSEVGQKLVQIVDPFSYLEDLTIPKLIVNGTNDRYWTIDSTNLYFDALLGEKYLLYVPNSGHGLEDRRRVINSILAFASSIVLNTSLPKVEIERNEDGFLTFIYSSSEEPLYVDSWITYSKNMDFRDSKWSSFPAIKQNGSYTFHIGKQREYTALFGELTFLYSGKYPFSLSTKMNVVAPSLQDKP